MKCKTPITASITLALLVSAGNLGLAQTPQGTINPNWRGRPAVLDPRCKKLPFSGDWGVAGLVELRDGSLMTLYGDSTATTNDDGKTWTPREKIYDGPGPGTPFGHGPLLKTRSGAIVLIYLDLSTLKGGWDPVKIEATPDSRSDLWVIRSLDEGKTWIDRQQLVTISTSSEPYGLIQTSSGRIVAGISSSMPSREHGASVNYFSDDDGKTWRQGNVVDLGGRGDHDGPWSPHW